MNTFFDSPIQFWFGFVFSSVLCTGAGAFLQCLFVTQFCNIAGKKRFYFFYLAVSYLTYLLPTLINIPIIQSAATLLGVAVLFGFLKWILRQNYIISLMVAALTVAVTVLVESIFIPLHDLVSRTVTPLPILLIVLLDLLALLTSYLMYSFFFKRYSVKSRPHTRYLLSFVLPIFFIAATLRVMNSLTYSMSYGAVLSGAHKMQSYEQLGLTLLAFLCICSILFAYEKTIKQIDSENAATLLEAEISAQRSYVAEAREKYDATKAFRHDFGNHIIALRGLIEQAETHKATAYLDRFEKIHEDISFPVNSGNTVVDVLLSEKLSYAKKLGINVRCDAIIPAAVQIDDFDLCAIIANALDNAIKASAALAEPERNIDFIVKPQRQFLVMDMVNHYLAGSVGKGSGVGLPTIRMIAEKYHGAVELETTGNTFRISIILPFYAN